MTRARFSRLCGAALLATSTFVASAASAQTRDVSLSAALVHPPDVARPMVRWWWFGPAVTKAELSRELHQMKADGIGGAELAFVYPEQLDGNLRFDSPEMLEMVHFAEDEGRQLGLRIDVTLCSGWPYGGPHITLANAATKLRIVELPIASGAKSIALPPSPEGDSFLYAAIADGAPKHWSSAETKPLSAPGKEGKLHLEPAAEERVAIVFYVSHTRQQVKRAAVGAEGYVLDPFSAEAVATHLNAVGKPLLSAFSDHKPYAIFSDSLEAYGADWTPLLPAEFKKRRGYDLLPHLPELLAGDTPAAKKVRHDYGRTLTELINENYLVQINNWARANGTRFRSQTYGEPAVSFSSQKLVDLAEGEGPHWRAFSTLRWASSANHVFGRNVTSGETYTWLHSPVFRATPLDMKAEADIDFLSGENQLIFHGWPYSPPASELPAGDPGWSLYAASVMNDHNPWHPVMPAVTDYITRVSYLLRQGQPANQVALLLPSDDAWANFIPGKVTITGAMSTLITPELMSTVLSAGYNVDFIDADAVQSVGMGSHQIVLLPPTERIPVATIHKLAAFAAHGGHVIALGKLPTMDADGNPLGEATKAMSSFVVVPSTTELTGALHQAVTPDFELAKGTDSATKDALGFIRRTLGDSDIYFVANTSNHPIEAPFSLKSNFTTLTELDPDNGKTLRIVEKPTTLTLTLAPYESRIYLLNDAKETAQPPVVDGKTLATLSGPWSLSFPAIGTQFPAPAPMDWSSTPKGLHLSGEGVYTTELNLDTLPKTRIALAVDGGTPLDAPPPPPPPAAEPTPAAAPSPNGMPPLPITRPGPGIHADFDPPIREAARVVVNGHDAGALWHPPYQLDITPFLKQGHNVIELHVFNTAMNAWSGIPPRDYGPLKAKFGDRFQMQELNKVHALPSGILGTVRLIQQESK